MTVNFDHFFNSIIENMVANDVANVGTGWSGAGDNDTAGGIPKVLGPMQTRKGTIKKKKNLLKKNMA